MAKYLDNTGLQYFWGKVKAYIDAKGGASLEDVYPIGSIYLNATDATNPATLLGFGTWERLGQGRMMIDADTTYTAGGTGGSATHDHGGNTGGHTLTTNEIPAHTHGSKTLTGTMNIRGGSGQEYMVMAQSGIVSRGNTPWSGSHSVASLTTNNPAAYNNVNINATHEHDSVGGGGAHKHSITSASNMPPWIGVYMWQRTA